jgi:hypothetical protein
MATGLDEILSPVRFAGKTYGISAIFSDSCSNTDRFLNSPDCVAKREGFELSEPFHRAPKRPGFSDLLRFHRRYEQTREAD